MTTEPIMIVEDDPNTRSDLAAILRDEGYTVVEVGNGLEAIGQLDSGILPCLIILDLMMPVMNGWEFREQMLRKPTLAEIPVLLLSGAADVREQSKNMMAKGFIEKPIRINRLL